MFVRVYPTDLVVGHKYKINASNDIWHHTGKFNRHESLTRHLFDEVVYHNPSKPIYKGSVSIKAAHYKRIEYFAFVPQKEQIQQAMEKRALNTILKRLVNDDFTW
jgi:hypothetical protein